MAEKVKSYQQKISQNLDFLHSILVMKLFFLELNGESNMMSEALGQLFQIYLTKDNADSTSNRIGKYIQALNENRAPSYLSTEKQMKGYEEVLVRFTKELGLRQLNTPPLNSFKEDYVY